MNITNEFEQLLYSKFKNCLLDWKEELRADTNLITFVCGEDSNFCQASFLLSYNTFSHYRNRVAQVGEAEAKWVPAEWICHFLAETPKTDNELELWHYWCRAHSIPVDDDLTNDPYSTGQTIYEVEPLFGASASLCGQIAQQLHTEGTIIEVFGRVLPIYITDAEGLIDRKETLQANGSQVIEEFAEFSKDWD